jgi:hypothetical protein
MCREGGREGRRERLSVYREEALYPKTRERRTGEIE